MRNPYKISDSEWKVMKVLWEKAPRTANEIVEELSARTDWKPKTVKTLLSRLLKKGMLRFENVKRTYHYSPVVGERECVKAESRSFLDRVYGGSLNLMLAHFLEDEKLSKEEIDQLRDLLDKKTAGNEKE